MVGSTSLFSVGVALCIAALLRAWRKYRLRAGLPLPPGPTGLPFIGSILDLDAARPWVSYEQWGKRYGGLVYVKLFGNDFIIINSVEVAHDLLERRSTIYSTRPYIPANELFGLDFNSALLPYGNKWRSHRKMFNAILSKEMSIQYKPLALSKAHELVRNLFEVPEDFFMHCKTFAAATIMTATYGYEVALQNDPFVRKVEHFICSFTDAMTPERSALLLAFPFLIHIPSWMPGGRYKQLAVKCRALAREVLDRPVEYVMEKMAAGTAGESFVRSLLEISNSSSEMHEEEVKAVAASAFLGSWTCPLLGGFETSDTALKIFLLAMVLYPEVQVEARKEIDQVVGSHRLPNFEDRPNLPFVEAVYRESLRWRPGIPAALPHMTETSDIYEGRYIPKGATVIVNVWAMVHDETRFDDPMAFIPERHLTSDGKPQEGLALPNFGFGRRICPGKFFADQNVWAAIVTILATLDISKARDELGNEIDVKDEFMSGLTSAPKPFVCSITARSPCAEDLIRMRHDDAH